MMIGAADRIAGERALEHRIQRLAVGEIDIPSKPRLRGRFARCRGTDSPATAHLEAGWRLEHTPVASVWIRNGPNSSPNQSVPSWRLAHGLDVEIAACQQAAA